MKPHMPKGLIRAIGALLTVLALYSLLGFLILPGIALRVANQQLANYAAVPAHIQRIELNPFSLEVTLWGLVIGEPGKEQVGLNACTPTGARQPLDESSPSSTSKWTNRRPKSSSPKTASSTARSVQHTASERHPSIRSKPFPLRSTRSTRQRCFAFRMCPERPIEFLYAISTSSEKSQHPARDSADMTLVAIGPNGGRSTGAAFQPDPDCLRRHAENHRRQ